MQPSVKTTSHQQRTRRPGRDRTYERWGNRGAPPPIMRHERPTDKQQRSPRGGEIRVRARECAVLCLIPTTTAKLWAAPSVWLRHQHTHVGTRRETAVRPVSPPRKRPKTKPTNLPDSAAARSNKRKPHLQTTRKQTSLAARPSGSSSLLPPLRRKKATVNNENR